MRLVGVGLLGGGMGTSVGFILWIHYVRHMDVLVAKLRPGKGKV